jgi:hypothetical protein
MSFKLYRKSNSLTSIVTVLKTIPGGYSGGRHITASREILV